MPEWLRDIVPLGSDPDVEKLVACLLWAAFFGVAVAAILTSFKVTVVETAKQGRHRTPLYGTPPM